MCLTALPPIVSRCLMRSCLCEHEHKASEHARDGRLRRVVLWLAGW